LLSEGMSKNGILQSIPHDFLDRQRQASTQEVVSGVFNHFN